jgi:hypothetical protein
MGATVTSCNPPFAHTALGLPMARILALAILTAAAAARAEGPGAAPAESKPFAVLLHVGPFTGFGGGLQVGPRAAGLRASVGWAPFLVALNTNQSVDLKFASTLLVSSDLYLRLLSPQPTTHIGAQGGYRYNSLLGHGLAAGLYAQFPLWKIEGLLTGGVLVFPDGENRFRREENLPGATFSFPGPGVNFGVSFGLSFYP